MKAVTPQTGAQHHHSPPVTKLWHYIVPYSLNLEVNKYDVNAYMHNIILSAPSTVTNKSHQLCKDETDHTSAVHSVKHSSP